MNMSFKSTKLKKSSSDWSNNGKAVIKRLSEKCNFLFLPRSPKALLR